MSIMVGIDLGTTNSLIGAIRDGQATLFSPEGESALLPSVVGFDDRGQLLVGREARNRRLVSPDNTVMHIKRHMGKSTEMTVGQQTLSPPQISALILSRLLDRAEAILGERPESAIITVPAYFDDGQRQATLTAGELAGLKIDRLVNEPTAAALTYQTGDEERVLVYDFGGGTFDVSVLERDEGFMEVLASRGDTELGGSDIDRALVAWCLERLGSNRAAVESDARATVRLEAILERAKIALSEGTDIDLYEPFLAGQDGDAVHLELKLTRENLEAVARPFIERTLPCIDAALADAKMSAADLDRILLVGGATRMPLVAQMVQAHLGRPVQDTLDADQAVALGAVYLAGRASGADIDEILVDITPHTLAAGVANDDMGYVGSEDDLSAAAVIPRDTVVPVERTETMSTMIDDQEAIRVPIVQGEGRTVKDNTWLGIVAIEDLPPAPAGSPVEITYRLDLSGVLHVSAKHVPSGRSGNTTITQSPFRLTAQERNQARDTVQALSSNLPEPPEEGLFMGPSEADLRMAEALLARADKALAKEGLDETAKAEAEAARRRLSAALDARDQSLADRIDELSGALLDLL